MTENIQTVLDDMRGAIVAGDYAKLTGLLPALSAAEKSLAPTGMADLAALRAKAAQNASCLDAAISGVKSARRRLREIAQAEMGLTTYDREGAKALHLAAPSTSRRV
jgi:hypothetical protein